MGVSSLRGSFACSGHKRFVLDGHTNHFCVECTGFGPQGIVSQCQACSREKCAWVQKAVK